MTPDAWDAVEAADMLAKGLPPTAGGTLDQAAVFLTAARFIWREQQHWKNELGIWP